MKLLFILLIVLPMLCALPAALLSRKDRSKGELLLLSVSVLELLGSVLLFFVEGSFSPAGVFGQGLSLASGGFHALMAVITALGWCIAALISPAYFQKAPFRVDRFYAFALFVLGATMGVFLSADVMSLFAFFEMMSLSSWVWVANEESSFSRRASETYLYIGIIGGLTMLSGIILLYVHAGSFRWESIAAAEMPYGLRLTAGLLILAGFGAKAGMFPLHVWLPRSYPAAPTPGTALLSGVLSKTGVYGIAALCCTVFSGDVVWGNILLVLAACTMFGGALLALFSTDLKRTLACSSMSQIGFILTGAALCAILGEHRSLAASGTILHLLNHSLIKLTLFSACAVLYIHAGSTELNALRGVGRGKPLLMLCFLLCAASVAGIPGLSGYVSKTLLHESILEAAELSTPVFYRIVEWVFLISGGLTFAYMSRLFSIVFLSGDKLPRTGKNTELRPALALLIGAVLMPVLGLSPSLTMEPLAAACSEFFRAHGAHGVHYFSLENLKGACISITVGLLVFFLFVRRVLTRREGLSETYPQLWPAWLDLEEKGYRPALKALAFLGALVARTVETLGALLVYLPINIIFYDAKTKWVPAKDQDFGTYVLRKGRSIVQRSFSLDLLCAAIGVSAFLLLVLIRTL